MARDIGIDLGTSYTTIYVKGKGVALKQPSLIAVNKNSGMVIAYGDMAKEMLGRTPANIQVIKPLQKGVVADYDATAVMLKHYINRVSGKIGFFGKSNVLISVPSGVSEVEQMAVYQAASDAGAKRHPRLVEQPVAAAIGAGLQIADNIGNMIVHIGGGTTEIAVVSMGGIVNSRSIRIGGDDFDEAITEYIKREYNVLIGTQTAENLKIEIGTAFPTSNEKTATASGRNIVTGLPAKVEIKSSEIITAISDPLKEISDAIHTTLDNTPPELSADICNTGIVLSGGSARLDGMDKYISLSTNTKVIIPENPEAMVINGIGMCLDDENVMAVLDANSAKD